MIISDEVKAALATLKAAAENDYERLMIERMENVIKNPPKIEPIDEKHVKFDGKIYFRDSDGYFLKQIPLHVAVWEAYNGILPEGYIIHHKDLDNQNNQPSNLQAMTPGQHSSLHSSLNYKLKCHREIVCPICGKTFIAEHKTRKYCSAQCRNKAKRRIIKKICPICGKEFETTFTGESTAKTCSHVCGGKLARRNKPCDWQKRGYRGRFTKEELSDE